MKAKRMVPLMVLFLSMLMASCCKKKDFIDLTYTLECSEELLKYATPEVTYKDKSGGSVTFQIPESDWETVGQTRRVWKKNVRYEDTSSADEEMIVTYVVKPEVPLVKNAAIDLSHSLYGRYNIRYDGAEQNNYNAIYINQGFFLTIGEWTSLEKEISQYRHGVRVSIHEGKVSSVQF